MDSNLKDTDNSTSVEIGRQGEQAAICFLLANNYVLIEQNYRCPFGEIDIIMKNEEYTVFIEVKFRKTTSFGYPREFVNSKKQEKIKTTAMHYIHKHQLENVDFRFDVIEIYDTEGNIKVEHIQDAFS